MLEICKYGNPVLRARAEPISEIGDALRRESAGMIEIMIAKNGVGLAAPQVGRKIRLFTMYVPPQFDSADSGKRLNPGINEPLAMVNPVILSRSGAESAPEGCLSIPDISAPVRRALEVEVAFLDLRGRERKEVFRGLMARVIQHELDHLDGILFVDRLSPMKKIALASRLRALKRESAR